MNKVDLEYNWHQLNKINSHLMKVASKYEGIVITSREEYSCIQKILCCKCFPCFQE